jgi:hypothetical protein
MNQTASSMTFKNAKSQYVPLHGFRDTLGDCLFRLGYAAWVKDACSLYVRNSDGRKYVVNPYESTCTCMAAQFGTPCKHKSPEVLRDLVFLSAAALEYAGKIEAANDLYEWWYEWTVYHNQPQGGRR